MSRISGSSSQSRARTVGRESRWRDARVPAWKRAWRLFSDSMREHPIFELDEARETPVRPGVIGAAGLTEAARESLFKEQWLRIFLVRLRLTASVGIFCVALFISVYFLIFPGIAREILLAGGLAIAGLAGQIALTFRVRSLRQVRALTFAGFALFAGCSALALSLVTVENSSSHIEAARTIQFIISASFAHILITSLIVPLRLQDTLLISVIVVGALATGLNAIPDTMRFASPAGAIWVVGTVALFITLLSHFNSRLRRRVFDAVFDLALQALKMKAISESDALTGGFNRRHCERVLATELARAARFGRPLSLLMFDLDNFKPVNDTLGHAAGDRVLIAVHEAASGELREVDALSRIGGDEFLILLPETDARQTQRIARRLHARVLRELSMRFGNASLPGKVTISVGALTLESGHGLHANQVLSRVDELLYSAKNQGKNRVVMGLVSDSR